MQMFNEGGRIKRFGSEMRFAQEFSEELFLSDPVLLKSCFTLELFVSALLVSSSVILSPGRMVVLYRVAHLLVDWVGLT